jgi:putative transposase
LINNPIYRRSWYGQKAIHTRAESKATTSGRCTFITGYRSVSEICREIGVTENTYYRWRTEYRGMRMDQARRLKELGRENARLKRAVADLTLDNQILKEAAEGNF